jgi:DNA polymerase-1
MFNNRLLEHLERRRSATAADVRREPLDVLVSGGLRVVATANAATAMMSEFQASPALCVGLDLPADDSRRAVALPSRAGVAVAVGDDVTRRLVATRYALDLRVPEARAALCRLTALEVPFVVHDLAANFLALRNLGIAWPRSVFSTRLAAQLLRLGSFHAKYAMGSDEQHRAVAAQAAKAHACSLPTLAAEFSVAISGAGGDQRGGGAALSVVEAEATTAGAFLSLALCPHLRAALVRADLARHYNRIELPGAIALAEVEHAGISVDRVQMARAREAAEKACTFYGGELQKHGFGNPRRHEDRVRVFGDLGLLERFGRAGHYSFDEDKLGAQRDAHPVVELLHRHTKYARVLDDRLLDGTLVADDGRVHPQIEALGADSGRPSFRRGNLPGIGRIFRPIVIPDSEWHALIELDFKTQEVMIAAAHFGDWQLLADCTNGDLYVRMVRLLCARELTQAQRRLFDDALAAERPDLRERMKLFVLALIYGGQPGSADDRRRFFRRYPQLRRGIERAISHLRARGHAETVTGLKRFRGQTGPLWPWEEHWAVNTPIQGGGACVLKLALPRLIAFLAARGGRVVLPIFDAFLIQVLLVDGAVPADVVKGAHDILVEAMRELYPATSPRISVNDADPRCWNKDGRSDSIERFAEDPTFKL